jgi:hypothetical protein
VDAESACPRIVCAYFAHAAWEELARSVRCDQSGRERIEHQLRAGRKVELAHDVGAVRLHGPHRDEQLACDLLVRVAEGERVENVPLPF